VSPKQSKGLPVALAKWIPDSLNPGGGNEYRIRDCPRKRQDRRSGPSPVFTPGSIHTSVSQLFVCVAHMLSTRNEEINTVFYSYLPCFVNAFTLNMYVSMAYTGLTRRNTSFIFWWLRHRNTWIPIQHVGLVGWPLVVLGGRALTFTRYSFTSMLFCTNQLSFRYPPPPALPRLLPYYCMAIAH